MRYFRDLQVTKSARVGILKVYPIFAPERGKVRYLWARDAMDSGAVKIVGCRTEQELHLTNSSNERVLFVEGLILDRGHQNRGVNATIMVPPNKQLLLPVSCVEKGRSTGDTEQFSCTDSFVPSSVRHTIKSQVTGSLSTGRGHHTDRDRVWQSISQSLDESCTVSRTESVVQVFESRRMDLSGISKELPYIEGATGVAFGLGDQLLGIEVFNDPALCRRLWTPLVEACAVKSLGGPQTGIMITRGFVRQVLKRLEHAEWKPTPATPGEGIDHRITDGRHAASALVVDDEMIHFGIVLAA